MRERDRDKDLHKNSPVHMKRFVACDVSLQHVAATSHLSCRHSDLSPQLVAKCVPTFKLHVIESKDI